MTSYMSQSLMVPDNNLLAKLVVEKSVLVHENGKIVNSNHFLILYNLTCAIYVTD